MQTSPADARGVQLVRALLEHGADPTADPFIADNSAGWSTLVYAAHAVDFEVALMLMNAGAEVNAVTQDLRDEEGGDTPLTMVVSTFKWRLANGLDEVGYLDFINLLLSRGASLEHRNAEGLTAEESVQRVRHTHSDTATRRQAYALLRGVRLAGGWHPFVNEPRASLLALRALCERGRAFPPRTRRGGVLTRLFETQSQLALPPPIFFNCLSFWRTDRDWVPPRGN